MAKQKAVAKAMPGKTANSKHSHPVVLTGKFAKEEAKESAHKKLSKGKK